MAGSLFGFDIDCSLRLLSFLAPLRETQKLIVRNSKDLRETQSLENLKIVYHTSNPILNQLDVEIYQ